MKNRLIHLTLWTAIFGLAVLAGLDEMRDPGLKGSHGEGVALVVVASLMWLGQTIYIFRHDP